MTSISPTTNTTKSIATPASQPRQGAKYLHPEDGVIEVVAVTNGRVIYTTADDYEFDMDVVVFSTLKAL